MICLSILTRCSAHTLDPNGISPKSKPKPLEVVDDESSTQSTENDRYDPLSMDVEKISNTSGKRKSRIGILLMDHGSRNPASNARLEQLATLYQMTMSDNDETDFVVEAAHMEIATPSIADGLETLLQAGVGTYYTFTMIRYTVRRILRSHHLSHEYIDLFLVPLTWFLLLFSQMKLYATLTF